MTVITGGIGTLMIVTAGTIEMKIGGATGMTTATIGDTGITITMTLMTGVAS